jgi:hypothetical protein
MSDCTGASVIAELEARIAELEAEVAAYGALKARYADLKAEGKRLKDEIALLKKRNADLGWDVKVAHSFSAELELKLQKCERRRFEWAQTARSLGAKLKLLRAENSNLKARLAKSPATSSMPPSSDPARKHICNSRKPSNKSPGGQVGHPGHRRAQHAAGETITLPAPCTCPKCGGDVEPACSQKRRTLTDLVITARTIEYVSSGGICTRCNSKVFAEFPEGVVNEANYGDGLRAAVTMLNNTCNVPIDKITGFLAEATGGAIRLSKGSVHNFLARFSKLAAPEIEELKGQLASSPVIGSDATCTRCAGAPSNIYTFNNPTTALFMSSPHKGKAPLAASVLGSYSGIIVHDHDPSYYNFGTGHGECNSHVLRYLAAVVLTEPGKDWAEEMAALLCDANDAAKAARDSGAASAPTGVISDINARFDAAIGLAESQYAEEMSLPAKYRPEGIRLYRRLKEYKPYHLHFLSDLSVPFDNNFSERLFRCAKGKTKQSGGFRSDAHGQSYYCDYLSIAQTARLRNMGALATVRDVFAGKADIFNVPPVPVCQAIVLASASP